MWSVKGVIGLQQQLWQHITLMWRYAKSASLKNAQVGTIVTITTKTERESMNSDIEFLIVDISNEADKKTEDYEFEVCQRMFSPQGVFKKFFKQKIPESGFYAKPLKSSYFNIDAVTKNLSKYRKEGEKEIGERSVFDMLLKMGIMCHLDKYETLEKAENAFIEQEKELLADYERELKSGAKKQVNESLIHSNSVQQEKIKDS